MNISDLNHIKAVEGNEVVGGYYYHSDYVYVSKNIYSNAYIDDNIAFADANAQAYGYDTLAQTVTSTTTSSNYSGASSTSVSASEGYYYYYYY